jgi:Flp pilus assembly CpaF family ATPase
MEYFPAETGGPFSYQDTRSGAEDLAARLAAAKDQNADTAATPPQSGEGGGRKGLRNNPVPVVESDEGDGPTPSRVDVEVSDDNGDVAAFVTPTVPQAPQKQPLTEADIASWEALKDRLFDTECTEISILPNPPDHEVPYVVAVNIETKNYGDSSIVFESEESLDRVIREFILPRTNIDIPRNSSLPPISTGTLTYTEEFDGVTEVVRARVQILTDPAVYRTSIVLCKLPRTELDLEQMVNNGTLDLDMAWFLGGAVSASASMVFSGAPGAGKTCLLNACTYEISEQEKVAVLQDVDELPLEHIAIQQKLFTHRATARSMDAIQDGSMSSLIEVVKLSRPERIITGECRDGAMLDHLEAASIFPGSLTTIHADSADQALDNMFFFANKHPHAPKNEKRVWELIGGSVDLIVHMAVVNGKRRVVEISEVSNSVAGHGKPSLTHLWKLDPQSGKWPRGDVGPSESIANRFAAVNARNTWRHPI